VVEFAFSANGETFIRTIKHLLSKNGLDIANCSNFLSNGASVMVGKENRIAAEMKLVTPTMLSVHRICHRQIPTEI